MKIEARAISPSETQTDLQIVCFPDQTKNNMMTGGTEAIDQHFNGAINWLRKADHFRGDLFETLLVTPRGEIPAKKLLLIGLGDPSLITLETLQVLGRISVREGIKLNVSNFSFAPSIRDAGLSHLDPIGIAESLARGMTEALKSARALEEKGLIPKIVLNEINILAGAKNIKNAEAGIAGVVK